MDGDVGIAEVIRLPLEQVVLQGSIDAVLRAHARAAMWQQG
jgi:hypothetical protein